MAERRPRRRFTAEFEAEAVKRLLEGGKGLSEVATELGRSPGHLSRGGASIRRPGPRRYWPGARRAGDDAAGRLGQLQGRQRQPRPLPGDAPLRCIAERLRGVICGSDVLARLGGDEFALVQVAYR